MHSLLTSSRLRGEVESQSESREWDYCDREPIVSPPHPDPLPASGERERRDRKRGEGAARAVTTPAAA